LREASPAANPFAFEVNGLTYHYAAGGPAALASVCLAIPRGEATAILGLSGSGKSTLLAILGRLIEYRARPEQVVFHSRSRNQPIDYATLDNAASNALRSAAFGFVMQAAYMLGNFTCRTNIELPLTLQGVAPSERRDRLLHLFDRLRAAGDKTECDKLHAKLDSLPSDLSTGQRQRMAVLRAMIHDPEVLFADEPCNSLDPLNASLFRDLLRSWLDGSDGGRTLVLVTHSADEACHVAAKIAIVERHGIGVLPLHATSEFSGPKQIERRIIECARTARTHLGTP
jgi:ABC-type lipoprotein export system ATPase subunit